MSRTNTISETMAHSPGLLLTDKLTSAKISHTGCNLNSSIMFAR